jgi:5'-nucleotidase
MPNFQTQIALTAGFRVKIKNCINHMTTILITNDDGISSPGIKAAVEAANAFGKIYVVAPTSQQTGAGRGIFGDKDLPLTPAEFEINGSCVEAYHCDCSPALIVRHSIRTIFKDSKPDLVISGINYGENLGFNITHSGTVGAALEGASFGIPGIAISKQTDIASHHKYTNQDWSVSVHFLRMFIAAILGSKLPFDVDVLKIDIPNDSTVSTEWKITNLAKNVYYFSEIDNPSLSSRLGDGKTTIKVDEKALNKNSDIYAFYIQKIISVTPISLDMTSRVSFEELNEILMKT